MNDEDLSFDELAETGRDEAATGDAGRRGPRRRRLLLRALPVLLVLLVLWRSRLRRLEGYRWITSNVSVGGRGQ